MGRAVARPRRRGFLRSGRRHRVDRIGKGPLRCVVRPDLHLAERAWLAPGVEYRSGTVRCVQEGHRLPRQAPPLPVAPAFVSGDVGDIKSSAPLFIAILVQSTGPGVSDLLIEARQGVLVVLSELLDRGSGSVPRMVPAGCRGGSPRKGASDLGCGLRPRLPALSLGPGLPRRSSSCHLECRRLRRIAPRRKPIDSPRIAVSRSQPPPASWVVGSVAAWAIVHAVESTGMVQLRVRCGRSLARAAR